MNSAEHAMFFQDANEYVVLTRFTDGDHRYDVAFDAAGKTTERKAGRVLADHGRFVTTQARRRDRVEDLLAVRDLMAMGAVRAVIGRAHTLDQMREAHRYVESGKRGNVVVLMAGGEQ